MKEPNHTDLDIQLQFHKKLFYSLLNEDEQFSKLKEILIRIRELEKKIKELNSHTHNEN